MAKKILIGKPLTKTEDSRYIIEFPISCEDKKMTLWYSVDEKWKDFVCTDTADGVVVSFLPYAMRGGYDIESELPLSQKLYFNLTNTFIPQMILCSKNGHETQIYADTIEVEPKSGGGTRAVATAMSCGVDSLTTYYDYISDKVPEAYRLTHLIFFQNGAHHGGDSSKIEPQQAIFENQLKNSEDFCKDAGVELVSVRSNIAEFMLNFFWHESYVNIHTYRTLGFVLLLQKGIKGYYMSPAYGMNDFECSLETTPAHYELFLIPNISTEVYTTYNTNTKMLRTEKLEYISKFSEPHKYLMVCYKNTERKNCGTCTKCIATLIALDVLGLLDKYSECFDIEKYRKNLKFNYAMHYCLSKSDFNHREIYKYGKAHGFKIPLISKIIGFPMRFMKPLAMKLKGIYEGRKAR